MSTGVYLAAYLAPLRDWLDRPDVTDIWVNRPGEVWIETTGGATSRVAAPELSDQALQRLARQIAAASHQGVSREQPLLSASLPDGARVQIIAPPATRGDLALAIRKHTLSDLSLSDLAVSGTLATPADAGRTDGDAALRVRLDNGDIEGFLRAAVKARKTIVLSGGTSSGKTTLLNALVKEIPPHERLVLIEDAPEIQLRHENAVGLIAARSETGEAQVDAEDLLQASLRMRPDRILLGELRGREAFAFLRAVNTGHPGSITTVHADSPQGALDQIALLSLLAGVDLGWDTVRNYVRQVVDVVVQLNRVEGARKVTAVEMLSR
ncbi:MULTISPECIES: P-type DNA transfer ATPase VirB11 [unclassified Caulobacter]|jgi:type IV secretion system protein VirB11|uniref:P-type DNA transfer ATPase VirB11 n=1 Tax=unclassified Caulobacter TaxID=2648921 RepID=UPI0007854DAD|nr:MULTISPECIES: P-type DNA transfer ATPase VirB11 [unclassified Caulobacter]AZS19803.1 P-type DNA transfer ATPase VirB11 [Caulobacter sp. FWC26]